MQNTNNPSISFYGAARTVTGSNFLLQNKSGTEKILIDCGLFQEGKEGERKNHDPFPYDPSSIKALFVTHAHMDHLGRIPKLVRDGFRGKIYSTAPTKELAHVMLLDSMRVLQKNAVQSKTQALYDEHDVGTTMSLWEAVAYHSEVAVGEEFRAEFKDAGHILGSAMVEFTHQDKKIVFTGDLGNSPAPLLRDTETITHADYLIMEATYGDRNHEDKEERKGKLEDVIEDTISRGGVLMIPAFSIERTQDLLFELNELVEHNRIPKVPVFLDSPLAIKVTEVYKRNEEYFNKDTTHEIRTGDDIFNFPMLKFTPDSRDSMAIREVKNPKIIMAGSGMSNGGRILHHEKLYLPDPKSTLLLVGYQAVGTLGRALEEGAKEVSIKGEKIPVRARVVVIEGYSAHKDLNALFKFVENTADSVKKVFLVHGEPKSLLFFAQKLRDYLGVNTVVPEEGASVELQ
ncbi:MAG: MBL fold metallo-hydrolase [Candidatus Yonathbacteria bacterium]|nr:MBL fold metallo-hydrolase [Candidatus Yonathbacteria bacterium]